MAFDGQGVSRSRRPLLNLQSCQRPVPQSSDGAAPLRPPRIVGVRVEDIEWPYRVLDASH
jgi:hypothetical protein